MSGEGSSYPASGAVERALYLSSGGVGGHCNI